MTVYIEMLVIIFIIHISITLKVERVSVSNPQQGAGSKHSIYDVMSFFGYDVISPPLVGQAASEEKLLWDNYDLSDLLFLLALVGCSI